MSRNARFAIAGVLLGILTAVEMPGLLVATPAQTEITDAELQRLSGNRTVAVGAASGGGRVATMPLESYVARVLAGEAEPGAPDAARQALAVAIRTFAVVNAGRHRREGFDLCDSTHCQVLRAANTDTRRAAVGTAGQVLVYNGAPAEVFYSASCGGRSEAATDVWPAARFPYLQSIEDDVHADDEPWILETTLGDVQQALRRAGFDGKRLTDLQVESRSASGRVARIRLVGLNPNAIAGEQFRAALGYRDLRSTAFEISRHGSVLRFTGRGYGHGVGMCVIGAGRRAQRGETVDQILARYYPGLELVNLDRERLVAGNVVPRPVADATIAPAAPRVVIHATAASGLSASTLERMATQAHETLSRALGTSVAPVTVELHESLEAFRAATGRPWWTNAAVNGTQIHLAPAALLVQRDGVEIALRTAMAELLIGATFADRPVWVRIGAARYFSKLTPPSPPASRVKCPTDAELTLALSATSQREAEIRAEQCFARALARADNWRSVR